MELIHDKKPPDSVPSPPLSLSLSLSLPFSLAIPPSVPAHHSNKCLMIMLNPPLSSPSSPPPVSACGLTLLLWRCRVFVSLFLCFLCVFVFLIAVSLFCPLLVPPPLQCLHRSCTGGADAAEPCPVGSASASTAALSATTCTACASNYYASSVGSTTCTPVLLALTQTALDSLAARPVPLATPAPMPRTRPWPATPDSSPLVVPRLALPVPLAPFLPTTLPSTAASTVPLGTSAPLAVDEHWSRGLSCWLLLFIQCQFLHVLLCRDLPNIPGPVLLHVLSWWA